MTYIPETNELIIRKNDYLKLDMGYYKYIGVVNNIKEVPETNCLFSVNGYLFIRRINLNKLNAIKKPVKPVEETDDSDLLDTEVHPEDDSTLVIVKELLKGFTKNSFRKLFDNDSDMNNMKRAIEKSPNGQLSLNRFRTILEKFGLKYKIIVYAEDIENAEIEEKLKRINSDELTSDEIINDDSLSSDNNEEDQDE